MSFPNSFPYRQPPFEKQREAMRRSAFERSFALFMEQGTGKSFVAINTAAAQWYKDWINALIIVAPKGVHTNWVTDEIPKWMPLDIPYNVIHWRTGRMTSEHQRQKTRAALADRSKMMILAINVDAISHRAGKGLVEKILRTRPSMLVIDESSDIANHQSDRSRAAHRLARFAFSRRILNGTPGDPLKLYSQFLFLDWRFLGQARWREYQLTWAEWNRISTGEYDARGKEKFFLIQKKEPLTGKPIFKNEEELQRRMYAHAFRCTKDECFDLPPKLYTKIYPTLNAEQHRMYRELVDDFETTFKDDGALVSVQNKLTLYLRLQQVICGYVPVDKLLTLEDISTDEPERMIDGPNDRLERLIDYIEHSGSTQGIIWTRFKMDVKLIREAMLNRGCRFGEIHGGIKSDIARTNVRNQFQSGEIQWIIGNQATGGRGYTLTAAKIMAFYSLYFGLEKRQQAEDRAHRFGTTGSLTITDFTTPGTIDEIIVRSLRNNREVADTLTGDIPKPWI